MKDVGAQIHWGLYKKSDDPEHEDNRNSREFLDGYAAGLTDESDSRLSAITDEWERRGCPEVLPDGFREWKRGFNAGSMRATLNGRAGGGGRGVESEQPTNLESPTRNAEMSNCPEKNL